MAHAMGLHKGGTTGKFPLEVRQAIFNYLEKHWKNFLQMYDLSLIIKYYSL